MRRILSLLAVLLLLPVAAAQARIATEQFAALPFMSDPKLSPDGMNVAALIALEGEKRFAIVPIDGSRPPAMLAPGPFDILAWHWVNDDWLVLTIGKTEGFMGSEFYVTRAVSVSSDANTVNLLAREAGGQNAGQVLWTADDGSPEILLQVQNSLFSGEDFWPEVHRIDVSTTKRQRVVRSKDGVVRWSADSAGNIRAGLGIVRRGLQRKLYYRAPGDSRFRTIERANVNDDEELTSILWLDPHGSGALVREQLEDGGRIRRYDLASGTPGEIVFEQAGYEVNGLSTHPRSGQPLGINFVTEYPEVEWLDDELGELQQAFDDSMPAGSRAGIVSLSRNSGRMLVHVGPANAPGRYYIWDPAAGKLSLFAEVQDGLPEESLAELRTIRYAAADGLELQAVLTLPPGRSAAELPLVVLPHGGPAARDYERFDYWAQFLASRGYAVVQPNYRGSAGFGHAFEDAAVGEWGKAMQDDINAAVAHLAQTGVIDPGRVCVMGGSFGGYMAMRAAERDPELYRCAISFAGVSDLAELRSYDRDFLQGAAAAAFVEDHAPDLDRVSPRRNAAAVGVPLLLVHGENDLRVPLKQSREMAEALERHGKPHRYVPLPDGDHYLSQQKNRERLLREVEAFLHTHNPA